MIKVFQNKVSEIDGDCMRAVVASLLEKNINDVPNFIEHREACYIKMDEHLMKLGYDPFFIYDHDYTTEQMIELAKLCGGVNGYFYASVPSQTYKDGSHAVVVDVNLNIVHDPNPNQKALSLKPSDVQYLLIMRDIKIPEHIKRKYEVNEQRETNI